jgi:quercetin dioxygenase-like cupin family protein
LWVQPFSKGKIMRLLFIGLLVFASAVANAGADATPTAITLLNSAISDIDDHHALVTRVTIPANLALPPHAHPTEEFLYVISGETSLTLEGQKPVLLKAGSAYKIPARAIHSASTDSVTAEIIVFRIQPNGQPVRIKQ